MSNRVCAVRTHASFIVYGVSRSQDSSPPPYGGGGGGGGRCRGRLHFSVFLLWYKQQQNSIRTSGLDTVGKKVSGGISRFSAPRASEHKIPLNV